MRNDVYDYTVTGQVAKNTVLQKTYRLLGLSFIPAVAGAYFSGQFGLNLFSLFGQGWMGLVAVLVFFYGMTFLIEKNRYSNVGATLLMIFTFGMGVLISPLLQYTLAIPNGTHIVGIAPHQCQYEFARPLPDRRRGGVDDRDDCQLLPANPGIEPCRFGSVCPIQLADDYVAGAYGD